MEATRDDREGEEEEDYDEESSGVLGPSFPMGKVKKIVKLDREISKVTSEALSSSHSRRTSSLHLSPPVHASRPSRGSAISSSSTTSAPPPAPTGPPPSSS
ncbi:unnamed protein product [Musa textilis]